MTDKPRKKKSLSAKLNDMRSSRDNWYDLYNTECNRRRLLERELDALQQVMPLKYYRIKFKIKCNSGMDFDFTEIIGSYSPELAIKKLKKNKTHPDTFELLDIECTA